MCYAWTEKHKIRGMRRVRIFRVLLVACHRCKQTKKSENQNSFHEPRNKTLALAKESFV